MGGAGGGRSGGEVWSGCRLPSDFQSKTWYYLENETRGLVFQGRFRRLLLLTPLISPERLGPGFSELRVRGGIYSL